MTGNYNHTQSSIKHQFELPKANLVHGSERHETGGESISMQQQPQLFHPIEHETGYSQRVVSQGEHSLNKRRSNPQQLSKPRSIERGSDGKNNGNDLENIELTGGETPKNGNQSSIQSHSIKILNLKFPTGNASQNTMAKRSLSSAHKGGTISMEDLMHKNAMVTSVNRSSQRIVTLNASHIYKTQISKSPIRSKLSNEVAVLPGSTGRS